MHIKKNQHTFMCTPKITRTQNAVHKVLHAFNLRDFFFKRWFNLKSNNCGIFTAWPHPDDRVPVRLQKIPFPMQQSLKEKLLCGNIVSQKTHVKTQMHTASIPGKYVQYCSIIKVQ